MHGDQIPIEDAGVLHRHADDLQQVMRPRREDVRIDVEAGLDVLLGEDRATRSDAADQRQADLLADGVLQFDASRGARHERNHPFTGERTQMLLGGIGGLEPELLRYLCPRWRHAGFCNSSLDESENFGLAGGEV